MRHLTISEAAEALQLSIPTIKRYIYESKINSVKLPGGQHRIPESEIERLLSPASELEIKADADSEQRITVLENWVTELEADIERLSAALEVVSRFCSRRIEQLPETSKACNDADVKHEIAVLGTGCKRCENLFSLLHDILENQEYTSFRLKRINDLDEIANYGPLLTPALVIDGNVVMTGKTLNETAVKNLLKKYLD